jgi:hypothetical protein
MFFKSPQIANPQIFWAQSAIANPQIYQVCKSTNFKSANFFWLIRKSQIRKLPHLRKIREYDKFADLWFARYSHLTLQFAHLPFSLVATQLQHLTICKFSKCDNMLLRVCFSKECKSFWSWYNTTECKQKMPKCHVIKSVWTIYATLPMLCTL